jgi:23S rRNA (uracil1939-C5)-methyltransferase
MPLHLRLVRDWIASLRTAVSQVELAVADPTARPEEQRVIVFGWAHGPFYQEDEGACLRLLAAHPLVAGVRLQGNKWCRVWGETSWTFSREAEILTVGEGAFTQVNTAANQLLVEAALRLSEVRNDDTVIELYCGSGNFSVALARCASKVIGVEHDDRAIANARANVARTGRKNARFLHAPAAVGIRQLLNDGVRGDVIVLDPPRTGAADIVDDLSRFGARTITYVSCDPTTLARDLRRLAQHGYRLHAVQPIDMFPQTYHVEVIAVSVLTC